MNHSLYEAELPLRPVGRWLTIFVVGYEYCELLEDVRRYLRQLHPSRRTLFVR